MQLWDAATGRKLRTLAGHDGYAYSIAFSPDGNTLATGGRDSKIRLWDVATGSPKGTLAGHFGTVYAVAFSPDGRTLASAGIDMLRLWNAAAGEVREVIHGLAAPITTVAFSPDNKTLATGSSDGMVTLWDTGSFEERATLRGHTVGVTQVTFSPDGKTLASCSWDKTVRLWRTQSAPAAGTIRRASFSRRRCSRADAIWRLCSITAFVKEAIRRALPIAIENQPWASSIRTTPARCLPPSRRRRRVRRHRSVSLGSFGRCGPQCRGIRGPLRPTSNTREAEPEIKWHAERSTCVKKKSGENISVVADSARGEPIQRSFMQRTPRSFRNGGGVLGTQTLPATMHRSRSPRSFQQPDAVAKVSFTACSFGESLTTAVCPPAAS